MALQRKKYKITGYTFKRNAFSGVEEGTQQQADR
jgi:hypothetical protein